MDTFVARNGISYVISEVYLSVSLAFSLNADSFSLQARASLTKPSRPFTPLSNRRTLLHRDDNRSVPSVPRLPRQSHRVSKEHPPIHRENLPSSTTSTEKASASASYTSTYSDKSDETGRDGTGCNDSIDSGSEHEISSSGEGEKRGLDHDVPAPVSLNMMLSALYEQLSLLDDPDIDVRSPSAQLLELRKIASEFTQASLVEMAAQRSEHEKDNIQRLRYEACDIMLRLTLSKDNDSMEVFMSTFPSIIQLCTNTIDEMPAADHSINVCHSYDERESNVICVAKALFSLSKDAGNDRLFSVHYAESILSVTNVVSDRLGQNCEPTFPLKALLYAFGTLKNVANTDEKMQHILATSGAIGTFAKTLLWSKSSGWKNQILKTELVHCLIQTTSLLRTLIQKKRHLRQFDHAQVSQRLCDLAACCGDQIELLTNIFRILSNLTLHEPSRAQINGKACDNIAIFLKILRHCVRQQDVPDQDTNDRQLVHVTIVRVVVTLGNLSAGNDRNREIIYFECDGHEILLRSLRTLLQQLIEYLNHKSDNLKEETNAHDIMTDKLDLLIRLVRLLANLSINSSISAEVTADKRIVELVECLQAIQLDAGRREYEEELKCQQLDELMLNIVSCITNLSYHSCGRKYREDALGNQDWIYAYRLKVTSLLGRTLADVNDEAVMEAARAFGNFTRWEDVVAVTASNGILNDITQLLCSENLGIVHAACGALMNAALCSKARLLLIGNPSGCLQACEAVLLQKGQEADEYADLIANVCKTIFNLLCVPFDSEDVTQHDESVFQEAVCRFLTSESGETLTNAIQMLEHAENSMSERTRSILQPIVSHLNTKLGELGKN
uniref:Uncharacterized protein AlNc14C409G11440 n=1 Tax=Albugo laibachii Nc14 TaxID=890382 RepID=F0WZ32_9STRA|nr:conserved hypothetical protein [Albugo laibachii Nc14]|eukprot:CCA26747.1 conserved hypothetical protein [Albugo laibachii Nc14]